jgi:hypothetical protein
MAHRHARPVEELQDLDRTCGRADLSQARPPSPFVRASGGEAIGDGDHPTTVERRKSDRGDLITWPILASRRNIYAHFPGASACA